MEMIIKQLFAQEAWVKTGYFPQPGDALLADSIRSAAGKAVESKELPLLRVTGEEKHPHVCLGRSTQALEMLYDCVQCRDITCVHILNIEYYEQHMHSWRVRNPPCIASTAVPVRADAVGPARRLPGQRDMGQQGTGRTARGWVVRLTAGGLGAWGQQTSSEIAPG